MINFFRHIRHRLLSDLPAGQAGSKPASPIGRFSKYLLYAIGETLLVVIGILITLQINNWNGNRIESQEELHMLKTLKIGLEIDLSELKFNENSIELSIASVDKVIHPLENNLPYRDSIADYIGIMMMSVMFVHSKSAFEILKSKGIDLIKNDVLRDDIIGVFD